VSSIVLIVGYKGDLIEAYVREHYPSVKVDFVEQAERRGIAHAIHLTRSVADTGEPLIVVLGDTIVKTDLAAITKLGANALGVKAVEDPSRFGVCELDDGRITALVEKPADPPSDLALVGLYYLQNGTTLFEAIQRVIDGNIMTKGEYQITDALQLMIEGGEAFLPFTIDEWFDCGKPEAMLETNRKLLEDVRESPRVDGSVVIPPVSISPGAEVVASIVGPYVSVAEGVVIDHSIVRDSVLAEGSRVKDSMLEGSLIGPNARVEGKYTRLDVGDSSEIIIP
jgi:glucose-1-phosphate thymidylyltransferase